MTHFNLRAMPTNNTNYNCHVEQSHGVYITPLVINGLGMGTQTHTDVVNKSNFKKPNVCQLPPS